MNFFEQQSQAHHRTGILVVLFVAAVVLIILSVYGIIMGGLLTMLSESEGHSIFHSHRPFFVPELFFVITGCTLVVVLFGTLYKISQLSSGGSVVAEMLGGRLVLPATQDFYERRLVNVVSEMAIASGVPCPPIYVLDDEKGINAFAAGFTSRDAVVSVTAGTLKLLNRDELQGVIAHEFSHIFNGDMRLNIRLMGVLNGILVIALAGYWIMRTSGTSRDRKDGGFVLVGMGLFVVGYIGMFFANLIKSAVSRQREFLADASAVQFTRNPSGIGNALKKIGGLYLGSRLENPRADEASHLYFANGIRQSFLGLLATHPPLEERIRRIDPDFRGPFPVVNPDAATAQDPAELTGGRAPVSSFAGGAEERAAQLRTAVQSIGQPTAEHLNYASQLLASLPPDVLDHARNAFSARALVYGLLLDPDAQQRAVQFQALSTSPDAQLYAETVRVAPAVAKVSAHAKLAIAGLAVPALGMMSKDQYDVFRQTIVLLMNADRKTTLLEFALFHLVVSHLDEKFRPPQSRRLKYDRMDQFQEQALQLIAILSRLGNSDGDKAGQAFTAGAAALAAGAGLTLSQIVGEKSDDELLIQLDGILREAVLCAPVIKRRLVEAAVACVAADQTVSVEEAELLRAICAELDCPVPPIMESLPLAA